MKFTRTFSGTPGQASINQGGPDQIEIDFDSIAKNLDPAQGGGGVGTENLQNGAATDTIVGNRTADPTIATASANTGTLTQLFSWITKALAAITGTDWKTPPNVSLNSLNADVYRKGAVDTALAAKAPLASPTFTGTVSGVTKAMVGLGSADNTADVNKAVLSATKLATPRKIGDANFDGTAAITHSAIGVYSKTELQTSGQAAVNFANLTNVPNMADASWKPSVATPAALPTTGNALGDQRVVLNDGDGKQAIYACVATTGDWNAQWDKVGDVDWMTEEASRVTQENARVSAESSRVTVESARVTAEGNRVTAENSRVSVEGARVTAENSRVSTESGRVTAESGRVTAESGRVTAESGRVTAESGRVTAENTRVSNENARKVWEAYSAAKAYVVGNKVSHLGSSYINIAGSTGVAPPNATNWLLIAAKGADGLGTGDMSKTTYDTNDNGIADRAETADKLTTARKINGVDFDGSADIDISQPYRSPDQTSQTPVTSYPVATEDGLVNYTIGGQSLVNLLSNGNFVGTTGWTNTDFATISVANNTMSVVGNGGSTYARTYKVINDVLFVGSKYYIRGAARVTNSSCLKLRILLAEGALNTIITSGDAYVDNPEQNKWYQLSTIGTAPEGITTDNLRVHLRHQYVDNATQNGKIAEFRNVIAIDLDAHGLTGKTVEELDAMSDAYFEGLNSVVNPVVVSEGKNLIQLDGENFEGGNLSTTLYSGLYDMANASVLREIDYYRHPIKANTTYRLSSTTFATYRLGWRIIDKYGMTHASQNTVIADTTFATPDLAAYIVFILVRVDGATPSPADIAAVQVMLEEGTVSTAYEPYQASQLSIPVTLRSLPNGVRDTVENGVHTKRVSAEYTLLSGDITEVANGTALQTIRIPLSKFSGVKAQISSFVDGSFIIVGFGNEIASDLGGSGSNRQWLTNATDLYLGVTLGTYADLAAAQAALAGTKILYQLATPVVTPLQTEDWVSYKGGRFKTNTAIVPQAVINTPINLAGKVEDTFNIATTRFESVGQDAYAFGEGAVAIGNNAFATGYRTAAVTDYAHAEGRGSFACAGADYEITAFDDTLKTVTLATTHSIQVGDLLQIAVRGDGNAPHQFDVPVTAVNGNVLTLNTSATITSYWDFVVEKSTDPGGLRAEGDNCVALATGAHAEGEWTWAGGHASHAEGTATAATGTYSHAEGCGSVASGYASHAEGYGKATADGAHAESTGVAMGYGSHAEGAQTRAASGDGTHAEGAATLALSDSGSAVCKITAFNDATKTVTLDKLGNISVGDTVHVYAHIVNALLPLMTVTAINGLVVTLDTSATITNAWFYVVADYKDSDVDGAHAEGWNTFACGDGAHAEGRMCVAIADGAHAEGDSTTASGEVAHAEGKFTEATAMYSHAEGEYTRAAGQASHAEGAYTQAIGYQSHAEGKETIALGNFSHAEGYGTEANGDYSHAEGMDNIAPGQASHAEGDSNTASGASSHTEGQYNVASNTAAHAEGNSNTASGMHSHAEGSTNYSTGSSAHAEGYLNEAVGDWSHAEGRNNVSYTSVAHTEGSYNVAAHGSAHKITAVDDVAKTVTVDSATGLAVNDLVLAKIWGSTSKRDITITAINGLVITLSTTSTINTNWKYLVKKAATMQPTHTEGKYAMAAGYASHAEGNNCNALGDYSHAEGANTVASGLSSHAEGDTTLASGERSHAEGYSTTASGGYGAHAEGYLTLASNNNAHAEGESTQATNIAAHAEGEGCIASGRGAHAGGGWTKAQGYHQTAIGQYNVAQGSVGSKVDTDHAFIIGNGTADGSRSNALAVNWKGDVTAGKYNGQSMLCNQSTADQAITAATRRYITGSDLTFAAGALAVGSRFKWNFSVTKTAAGTAASTIDVCLGTLGTTGDTARLSFAKPAGTAVVDTADFEIEVTVRAVGASAILIGRMRMMHNLSATGFATIPCVAVSAISAAFDVSTATKIGVCITTGASDAYTIKMVTAEATNL